MYQFDFTDDEWKTRTEQLNLSLDIRDWVMLQISRGQAYYVSRIEQIGFRGGKVLDAGCGMGNWCLGLVRWFEEVHALEIDRARLAVLENVSDRFPGRFVPKIGSIENIPYEADTFDAIFCNGVIFETNVRQSLHEFARVLKPGGKLYVTFSSKDWWIHLIRDRGPSEPECLKYGCNGLFDQLVCRLDQIGFERDVAPVARNRIRDLFLKELDVSGWWTTRGQIAEKAFFQYSAAGVRNIKLDAGIVDISRSAIESGHQGGNLASLDVAHSIDFLERNGLPEHKSAMVDELACRLLLGRALKKNHYLTTSFEPEEFCELLREANFIRILASIEGTIKIYPTAAFVSPVNGLHMGVYEALATVPLFTTN